MLTAYLCFTQLTGPLRELHRILDEFSECMVLADDYFRLLQLPVDFSYTQKEKYTAVNIENNAIELEGVSFHYPEKPESLILPKIDLTIPAGKFIGIAGPSGSGKSSLIKIIDKLESCEGTIRLGGVDLARVSRRLLAENIVLVPQSPFLIADSIAHNITYGLKEEVGMELIQEAAKKACIAADIERLEGGYAFQLAEGGRNLSGGQRQRIALARIFLRKPKVLILDEATSALDNTTETQIQQEIEALKKDYNTTVISIAHRLSTLKNCDEILVIDEGKIVQRGTFTQLEHTPGLFQDMLKGKRK